MRGSIFYLNFKSRSDIGRVRLESEPVGFDSADFAILQEDGRMGRDVSFAGGTGKFQFSRMMHPEVWDNIQNTIDLQGYEAVIDLEIDYGGLGNIVIIGNLDLFTCENDTYDIISTDVILDQDQSRIKKNAEAKTDLFSSEDIDGEDIEPVDVSRILIKAKPLNQLSKFKQPEPKTIMTGGPSFVVNTFHFNYSNQVLEYGIDNTLSFIQGLGDRGDFGYIEAQENLSNVTLKITNLNVTAQDLGSNQMFNRARLYLYYYIGPAGIEPPAGTPVFAHNWNGTPNNSTFTITDGSYTFSNLNIPRSQRLYIWFESYVNPIEDNFYVLRTTISSMDVEITGTSTSYSSVNNAVRLRDAVAYNSLSAGKTTINFPMANNGGVLYNNYLLNGNLLRNITDKPFYLTFKDITEWLPECNLDYEIENDGRLFFGTDKNFFPNVELGVFDIAPELIGNKTSFSEFKKNFNEAFGFNLFEYKFKNYQSQKENDIANTYDGVHGETQYKLFNQNVSNKKEISVGFIRDAFLLEENRTKALSVKNNTATQDDDKVFILDVYPKNRISGTNITFNESDTLLHEYDDETDTLTLKNQGNFSFILLGILAGYKFRITSTPNPQFNQGLWNVIEVSSNSITLQPADGTTTHTSANNGERYTNFEYYIKVADIDGVNWTDEEFTQIENVANPSDFSNLKFSIGRNVQNYYESVLASANIYHKEVAVRNLFYKNNPDAITTFDGFTVREGENFVPQNPLLSAFLVTTTLIMTFDVYYQLMQDLRSASRGFIRCFSPEGNVLRVYPKDMRFRASAETFGTVTLVGQLKYEPFLINISTVEQFNLVLNNEYRTEFLRYEVKNNYFYIKDENGLLLYNRLAFDQIAINGAKANSVNQLRAMLDQYTEI